MAVKKKNGKQHWYIVFEYNGKRREVNSGETIQWKAERISAQKRAEWIERHEAQCSLTFDQIEAWDFRRYANEREDTHHYATSIGVQWRRLREFFTNPAEVTYEKLEEYVAWRKSQKRPDGSPAWTNKTLRGHLMVLKRGLKDAKEVRGFASLEIPKKWPKLKLPKNVKGKRYASNNYSIAQLKTIIGLLQGHAQDEALFLACTGLRGEEAEKVKISHFTPRDDMSGCAGTLYVPAGWEDEPREIGIPEGLLPVLRRALPFTIDHKRAYRSACKVVTGKPKIGRRDFRAAFVSALAEIDPFGGHKALGHTDETEDRYHNWTPDRMAKVALAVFETFAPQGGGRNGGVGDELGDGVGDLAYRRKRLKSKTALYRVK